MTDHKPPPSSIEEVDLEELEEIGPVEDDEQSPRILPSLAPKIPSLAPDTVWDKVKRRAVQQEDVRQGDGQTGSPARSEGWRQNAAPTVKSVSPWEESSREPDKRCPQCDLPLEADMPRCPRCGYVFEPGAEDETTPVKIEVAHDPRKLKRPPAAGSREERTAGAMPWWVWAIAGTIAVGTLFVGIGLFRGPEEPTSPVALPSSSTAIQQNTVVTINGVEVGPSARIDPTDLLPKIAKRVREPHSRVYLVQIHLRGVKPGKVDLKDSEVSVTYRYLVRPDNPGSGPPEHVVALTLSSSHPTTTTKEGHEPIVAEPLCLWTAMWKAALGSGLPRDARYEVLYTRGKDGAGLWRVRKMQQEDASPSSELLIDGRSCVIKAQ